MIFDQFFLFASVLIGVAQIADAYVLARNRGVISKAHPAVYFSLFEYFWAAFCLFLLTGNPSRAIQIPAVFFVLYIPAAWVVAYLALPPMRTDATFVHLPMISVYFGGFFGLVYIATAIAGQVAG